MQSASSHTLWTFTSLRAISRPGLYHRTLHVSASRYSSQPPYARPGPPPLPREDQREFEELVRNAQAPAAATTKASSKVKPGEELHPDARRPIPAQFVGDVNPVTGERGGPKQEPVPEGRNDWSFGGRVTDF